VRPAGVVVALFAALAALPAAAGPEGAGGPRAAGTQAESLAAEHYLLHCSGCHGADGRGIPGVTPSLHGLAPLATSAAGRAYLARVPGVAQAPLSDADLAALLDWLLIRFSFSGGLRPFEPHEVGRLRAHPLRDPVGARAALRAGRAPGVPRAPDADVP
jgi:mono/diheme cytochrome c family protein